MNRVNIWGDYYQENGKPLCTSLIGAVVPAEIANGIVTQLNEAPKRHRADYFYVAPVDMIPQPVVSLVNGNNAEPKGN